MAFIGSDHDHIFTSAINVSLGQFAGANRQAILVTSHAGPSQQGGSTSVVQTPVGWTKLGSFDGQDFLPGLSVFHANIGASSSDFVITSLLGNALAYSLFVRDDIDLSSIAISAFAGTFNTDPTVSLPNQTGASGWISAVAFNNELRSVTNNRGVVATEADAEFYGHTAFHGTEGGGLAGQTATMTISPNNGVNHTAVGISWGDAVPVGGGGSTTDFLDGLLIDGDSTTQLNNNPFMGEGFPAIFPGTGITQHGTNGHTYQDILNEGTKAQFLINGAGQNIVVLMAGINDISSSGYTAATLLPIIESVAALRKSEGWDKVIVVPVPAFDQTIEFPGTRTPAQSDPIRAAVNSALLGLASVDAVVDISSLTRPSDSLNWFDNSATVTDTTYRPDRVHFNTFSNGLVEDQVEQAIRACLFQIGTPGVQSATLLGAWTPYDINLDGNIDGEVVGSSISDTIAAGSTLNGMVDLEPDSVAVRREISVDLAGAALAPHSVRVTAHTKNIPADSKYRLKTQWRDHTDDLVALTGSVTGATEAGPNTTFTDTFDFTSFASDTDPNVWTNPGGLGTGPRLFAWFEKFVDSGPPPPPPPTGNQLATFNRDLYLDLTLSPGTTYYVDGNSGNDGNSGTSLGQAWKTMTHANNTVPDGSKVNMRGPVLPFNSTINLNNSGSPGNWITYYVEPGQTATIDTNSGSILHMIHIFANYVQIHGLDIVHQNYNSTNGHDRNSNGILIEGFTPGGNRHHIRLIGNWTEGFGHGIHTGGEDILVAGNIMVNNAYWNNQGGSGFSHNDGYAQGGPSNDPIWTSPSGQEYTVAVIGNLSYGNKQKVDSSGINNAGRITDGGGIIFGDQGHHPTNQHTTRRNLIANNICLQNGGRGINIFAYSRQDIFNNFVGDNGRSRFENYGYDGLSQWEMAFFIIPGVAMFDINVINNVFWRKEAANDLTTEVSLTLTHNTYLNHDGGGTFGSNSIRRTNGSPDPFTDSAAGFANPNVVAGWEPNQPPNSADIFGNGVASRAPGLYDFFGNPMQRSAGVIDRGPIALVA